MPKRALLLVNRKARRGHEDLARIRERLSVGGLELIEPPESGSNLSDVIRQHQQKADLVILGGGDGTINQSLEGLWGAQLPLGVLPLGTANDFARTLTLPADPLAACDVIVDGHMQRIDLGKVNDHLFVNVASMGLASEVTRRLSRSAKTHWGVLAYLWASIGAMLRGRPFTAEISCDGEKFCVRTWQVAVGNGRNYGGGMTIHENARIDDGLLDLYSLEMKRVWQILPLLPALRRGRLDPVLPVRSMRGKAIEVRPLGRHRSIIADGERVGTTPAVFRLLPQALSVFVPIPQTDV